MGVWGVAAFVAAGVAHGIRAKAAEEPGFMMQTFITFVIGVRNLALGVGLAAGTG